MLSNFCKVLILERIEELDYISLKLKKLCSDIFIEVNNHLCISDIPQINTNQEKWSFNMANILFFSNPVLET